MKEPRVTQDALSPSLRKATSSSSSRLERMEKKPKQQKRESTPVTPIPVTPTRGRRHDHEEDTYHESKHIESKHIVTPDKQVSKPILLEVNTWSWQVSERVPWKSVERFVVKTKKDLFLEQAPKYLEQIWQYMAKNYSKQMKEKDCLKRQCLFFSIWLVLETRACHSRTMESICWGWLND